MGLDLPIPTPNAALGTTMIGEWLSTDPIYGEGRYVIVGKAGQLRLEIRFLERGMVEYPLVERQSSAGRRFNYADTGRNGSSSIRKATSKFGITSV